MREIYNYNKFYGSEISFMKLREKYFVENSVFQGLDQFERKILSEFF